MRKVFLWYISAGITSLLWVFSADYRIVFSILLLMHIPVFVWGIVDLRNNFFCKALFHKKGEKHLCALTFDDGPDPRCTPVVLDLLDKYKFKATFFLIASNVLKYPDLTREILSRGHVIGCHDLTHSLNCNFRFSNQMFREIGEAQSIIEAATGKKPRFYRPPVGLSNPHLQTALNRLHMQCIGWSSSVGDAGNRRKNTFRKFYSMSSPGTVLLLHDTLPVSSHADSFFTELEHLFIKITDDNIKSVPVDVLFSEKAYL